MPKKEGDRIPGSARTRDLASIGGYTKTGAPRQRTRNEWTLREMRLLERHYANLTQAEIARRYMPHRTIRSIEFRARLLGLTKMHVWLASEDALVRERYRRVPLKELQHLLPQRSAAAIVCRAVKLGVSGPKGKPWTPRELRALKLQYERLTTREFIVRYAPGRQVATVRHKAMELGLTEKASPDWEKWELDILRKHYRSNPHEIRSLYLPHRSLNAIKHHAYMLERTRRKGPRWTPEEDRVLREAYPKMTALELRERHLPHRLLRSIRHRIRKLGGLGKNRSAPWTRAELALIRREFPRPGSRLLLCKRLGCSERTLLDRARELGLYGRSRR